MQFGPRLTFTMFIIGRCRQDEYTVDRLRILLTRMHRVETMAVRCNMSTTTTCCLLKLLIAYTVARIYSCENTELAHHWYPMQHKARNLGVTQDLTRLPSKTEDPDVKWTRNRLVYRESNHFLSTSNPPF